MLKQMKGKAVTDHKTDSQVGEGFHNDSDDEEVCIFYGLKLQ